MRKEDLLEQAKIMFLNNAGRKEVLAYFESNDLAGEEAETLATDAFKSIRDERRKTLEQNTKKENRGSGLSSLLFGVGIVVVTGAIAYVTDYLFYVAFLIGFFMIIRGLLMMATGKGGPRG